MSDTAYTALALQQACHAVNRCARPDAARERMAASLERISRHIAASKAFVGPGYAPGRAAGICSDQLSNGEDAATWAGKAALEINGPEYEALSKAAQASSVFIAGNAYERDPKFPELYFQTSFLIDDAGSVVLRYRRLVSLFAPSPYDVWDAYLDAYGLEGVFPVATTALGRIAAIASEEILYPEIARIFAARGAEVFVHSSSEVASPHQTPKDVAKRARAIENLAYVVSANTAAILDIDLPAASVDRGSQIVDYRGNILAEADIGESMVANAEIDLAALRRYRRRPGMGNILSRQPMQLWLAGYQGMNIHPQGTLMSNGQVTTPSRQFYRERQQAVINRLAEDGLI